MRTRIIGTDTLMIMAKQMKDSKEITEEEYLKCKERNEKLSKIIKKDIIIDEVM